MYIEDFIPILEKAISGQAKNSVVNFGTGHGTSILQVVKLVGKVLGVEPNISWQPALKGEISNFVADTRKIENLFGVIPKTLLEEGLQKILNIEQLMKT